MFNGLLEKLPREIIKIDEPMKNHTSFKIGGIVDCFVVPKNVDQLKYTINICNSNDIPYYVIGNGTNLLVSDKGIRGIVVQIYKNMDNYAVYDDIISADSGIMLSKLANISLENNLSGIEFASGIPGTLGGAVSMNAGAYGGEMSHIIESCTVMDGKGNIYTLNKEQLQLGYRTSIISKQNLIALNSKIKLTKGNYNEIKNRIEDLNMQRKTKQPLDLPSAGSVFKRPVGNYAGKLIMDAGLKGFSIGEAQVSEKHCGFIINKGNATCKDVVNLIKYIQKTVKTKFDIDLETEVKFVGEL